MNNFRYIGRVIEMLFLFLSKHWKYVSLLVNHDNDKVQCYPTQESNEMRGVLI